MRTGALAPLGGAGSIVEADETYFGKTAERPTQTKSAVPSRGRGSMDHPASGRCWRWSSAAAKSAPFTSMRPPSSTWRPSWSRTSPAKASYLPTKAAFTRAIGREFADHLSVNHAAKEYVRGAAHTNTLEGYFSIFKRGMKGVYQHCGEQHLHRYLAEFDFRYNQRVALGVGDEARTQKALSGIVGKRLKYRDSSGSRV